MNRPRTKETTIEESEIPVVLIVIFLGILSLGFTLCFWPLIPLFGYPVLTVAALIFLVDWFIVRGAGLRSRRLAQLVCLWSICIGLVLIMHGTLIGMDMSLKGSSPTPEEKQLGRHIAFAGAGLGSLAIVGSYTFQSTHGPRKKPISPDFDEITGPPER